jgi:hypothetical protein
VIEIKGTHFPYVTDKKRFQKKKTNGREKKEPGKKDPTSSIPPLSLSL